MENLRDLNQLMAMLEDEAKANEIGASLLANSSKDYSLEEALKYAYNELVAFMFYETKKGGKEHYNNIIAKYNEINSMLEEKLAGDGYSSINACSIAYYMASLIDTMEVMDQALYEIFGKLRDYYKSALKLALDNNIYAEVDEKAMIVAYSALKACRMNVIHTEKYEAAALDILNKAKAIGSFDGDLSVAYNQLLKEENRNRAFQDYGRLAGGVLWN